MSAPYRDAAPPADLVQSMFGNFAAAQHRKAPKWAAPVLIGAVIVHIGVFGAMWIKSIWDIEQLEPPKSSIDLAAAPAPPPPPPPPKGGAKPQETVIVPKKIKVKDIVQPVKIEKQIQQETKPDEQGDPNGEEGGEVGGVAGGVVGGVQGAPPPPAPPPPPPPPAPPQNVAPNMLEGQRIAGDKNITPDDVTKTEISRSGKNRLIASFKLCITLDGNVGNINMLKSSTFPAYDAKIQREMHTWRYHPYEVNGKAVPVCTAVTFIYSQN